MTREEFEYSIKSCGFLIHQGQTYYEESELIKAFEDMGLIEQEPSGDLISRQAVIDQTYLWSKDEFLRVTNPFDYLRKRIMDLPSVKQEPKIGHWRYVDYKNARCSNCNYIQTTKGLDKTMHCNIHKAIYKYCPNCGAKMVEPQESEDKE